MVNGILVGAGAATVAVVAGAATVIAPRFMRRSEPTEDEAMVAAPAVAPVRDLASFRVVVVSGSQADASPGLAVARAPEAAPAVEPLVAVEPVRVEPLAVVADVVLDAGKTPAPVTPPPSAAGVLATNGHIDVTAAPGHGNERSFGASFTAMVDTVDDRQRERPSWFSRFRRAAEPSSDGEEVKVTADVVESEATMVAPGSAAVEKTSMFARLFARFRRPEEARDRIDLVGEVHAETEAAEGGVLRETHAEARLAEYLRRRESERQNGQPDALKTRAEGQPAPEPVPAAAQPVPAAATPDLVREEPEPVVATAAAVAETRSDDTSDEPTLPGDDDHLFVERESVVQSPLTHVDNAMALLKAQLEESNQWFSRPNAGKDVTISAEQIAAADERIGDIANHQVFVQTESAEGGLVPAWATDYAEAGVEVGEVARVRILNGFGLLPDALLAESLERVFITDESSGVRCAALLLVAERILVTLIAYAVSSSTAVDVAERIAAVPALQAFGAEDALTAMLADGDAGVVHATVVALATMLGSERAAEVIKAAGLADSEDALALVSFV